MKTITFKPSQQIQQIKKNKFLDTYKKTDGNITASCKVAGVERSTYYDWLDADKEFTMKVLDAEAGLNDEIRQVLIKKAKDKDMTAVIFYLKYRHPDFKDQPLVAIQSNVQVNLTRGENEKL